ncbi:nucleoside-diphosphate kinase [Candidatus Latescibacterota bacterium]
MEQTLLLIKPNVIEDNKIGAVISVLEEKGIVINNMRIETLTRKRAEGFYEIHRGKPFFENLVKFMTSGPVIELILEHENCVEYVRQVIGNTDPEKAEPGTIRRMFARSLTENAVHASDSADTAKREIAFIFGDGLN